MSEIFRKLHRLIILKSNTKLHLKMKNKRRSFFQKSLLALTGLTLSPIAMQAQSKKKQIDGKFVHMVFFWLKENVDADKFRNDTSAFLKKVPEVVKYHLGEPAGTPRGVVDNTYTVSLVVTFHTKEDQDAYQENADHKAYVVANKDQWTEVRIFDSWSAL